MSFSKYEITEFKFVQNFPECLNRHTKSVRIGLNCFDRNWSVHVFRHSRNGQQLLTPALVKTRFDNNARKFAIHYSVFFLQNGNEHQNGVERKGILGEGNCLRGDDLLMEDVLNEDCGYLDEGFMWVKVGISIEAIFDINWIPNFNFDYLFYGNLSNFHQLRVGWEGESQKFLFCHLQCILLHSTVLSNGLLAEPCLTQIMNIEVPDFTDRDNLKKCFQIGHGVRIPIDGSVSGIANLANAFGMRNVIRYCEDQAIQNECYFDVYKDPVETAIFYKMERLLKHILIHVDNVAFLRGIIKNNKMEWMSGETMKTFVAKFLSIA